MLRYLKNEKGLTLSEALVAITILGIAVLGLMGMFTTANFIYFGAGKETVATNLAQQKIEEVKSLPWANVTSVPANANIAPIAFSAPYEKYSFRIVVTEEIVDLKRVEVTVFYKAGNSNKDVKLTTKISVR